MKSLSPNCSNRHGLSIRGDSYYCPLSFSLDSYWNCEVECLHCYLRRLNRTWGKELRPTNPEALRRKLENGLKTKIPKSSLASAIQDKKTIRFGNKSDPFQPAERELKVSRELMKILIQLGWSFVIQTKCTALLMEYKSLVTIAHRRRLIQIMPVISPGLEMDWEVFERKRTTNPIQRLEDIKDFSTSGVNGEPFIPGYHTLEEFEETIKLLKSYGIKSYNTYNLHMNDLVAKNLAGIGLDIEKIWRLNQDKYWYAILQKLLSIAEKHSIILGCPDFVNSGWKWKEKANTCCGLDVPNPCTFNTHHWKKRIQDGESESNILKKTWDGVGDYETGRSILDGSCSNNIYCLKDIK